LRLFETYQNAFQRVVEVGMGAKEGDNDMLNREILQVRNLLMLPYSILLCV
jgi:hypothetical protein